MIETLTNFSYNYELSFKGIVIRTCHCQDNRCIIMTSKKSAKESAKMNIRNNLIPVKLVDWYSPVMTQLKIEITLKHEIINF